MTVSSQCIQHIRGFGNCALYKSTFYLLNYACHGARQH